MADFFQFQFISDPGHGWLVATIEDVEKSGAVISPYSFVDEAKGVVYLEEDCDAGAYIDAIGATTADKKVSEVHFDSEHPLRKLPRYEDSRYEG